jgi:hypothetical protein
MLGAIVATFNHIWASSATLQIRPSVIQSIALSKLPLFLAPALIRVIVSKAHIGGGCRMIVLM